MKIFHSKAEARNKGVDYINYQGKDWDTCGFEINIEEFKNGDVDYISFPTDDGWVSLELVPTMIDVEMIIDAKE